MRKYYLILIILSLGALAYATTYIGTTSSILPVVADVRSEISLPILMYHKISEEGGGDEYTITKEQFETGIGLGAVLFTTNDTAEALRICTELGVR